MKTLVLTQASETIQDVYAITGPSIKEYALLHGYDFHNMSMTIEGLDGFKIFECASSYVGTYDTVLFIGCDSLVTNPIKPIMEYQCKTPITASLDWWTDSGYFSMGNYILRNTPLFGVLMHEYYLEKGNFPHEQDTINHVCKKFPWLASVLPNRALNAVPEAIRTSKAWSESPRGTEEIRGLWQDGDFLMHVTGADNESRVRILNEYLDPS